MGASRQLRVRLTGTGLGVSRCPGPLGGDLDGGNRGPTLATGMIPLNALRSRRITVPLEDGGTLVGPGYLGRTRSTLSVVLERGTIRLGD